MNFKPGQVIIAINLKGEFGNNLNGMEGEITSPIIRHTGNGTQVCYGHYVKFVNGAECVINPSYLKLKDRGDMDKKCSWSECLWSPKDEI